MTRPTPPQGVHPRKLRQVRVLLIVEAAAFAVAASIHAGLLIPGYAHAQAQIAESIIALILAGGAALTWLRPARARTTGLVAQGLALFGVGLGLTAIALGVGPRTVPDLIYHAVIVLVLAFGLLAVARRGCPLSARRGSRPDGGTGREGWRRDRQAPPEQAATAR